MNMKRIMKKAHKIAKELVGDYAARMSFALKAAWAEFKNRNATVVKSVKYYAYKNCGYGCFETVKNSYNASTKTIDVIVPADEKKMFSVMIEKNFNYDCGIRLYDEIIRAVETTTTISAAISKVRMIGVNNQFDIPRIFKMLGYAE